MNKPASLIDRPAPIMQPPVSSPIPTGLQPAAVGFDFDGVIADIGEAFIRLACREYGYCSIRLEDIRSFQIELCLPLEPTIVDQIFAAILHDSLGTGLKPMNGAIATLTRLSRLANITVITARSELQPVRDWLDYHCPAETARHIKLIATGNHDNKESFIKKCGLHHFIDDRARTCQQLAEAGLEPIVYTQPWNRSRHNLPSVADWTEIAGLFDFSTASPP